MERGRGLNPRGRFGGKRSIRSPSFVAVAEWFRRQAATLFYDGSIPSCDFSGVVRPSSKRGMRHDTSTRSRPSVLPQVEQIAARNLPAPSFRLSR